jgi:hypothetical protein
MSYKQHDAMESNGGVCMHALVPLSHDGLIVQFFYNCDDNNGTLIKIMPTTILLFPSTAIMEYGRLTHINGHRHLLIKVLYTKKPKNGQPTIKPTIKPAINLKDSIREYPHLSDTMKGMEDKNGKMPDDWEREFRFVTYPKLANNKTEDSVLKFLESEESAAMEDLYAI